MIITFCTAPQRSIIKDFSATINDHDKCENFILKLYKNDCIKKFQMRSWELLNEVLRSTVICLSQLIFH